MYNSYKHCFQRERYVDVLWMEVYRNCLAQFRMGVSQINLHRHRFSTITDNTTCPFCATQQETEIHFVFQCPVYNQLRSKYLPYIINVRDPRKHLIILMNSSSQEEIINVAKFLVCAFNLRSSKLWLLEYHPMWMSMEPLCKRVCLCAHCNECISIGRD